jgi:hypothetical protein
MRPTTENRRTNLLLRGLAAIVRVLVTAALLVYHLLEALFAPLLRPIWRWLSSLRVFQAIGIWIGRQHPYFVLLLLGVPFAAIEPAKYLAVIWGVLGHPVEGAIILAVAEVLSLLICERIFQAGYEPLMRIGWFRRLLAWLFALRDRGIAWAKSTAAWRVAIQTWQRLRRLLAR